MDSNNDGLVTWLEFQEGSRRNTVERMAGDYLKQVMLF